MTIPLQDQYYVEKDRNVKYQWLVFALTLLQIAVYGLLFHHIPRVIRLHKLEYPKVYKFMLGYMKAWNMLATNLRFKHPWKKNTYVYCTPSYALLLVCFFLMMGRFSYIETADITYEPRSYIISKRVGRVGIGILPLIYLFVIKSDLVRAVSGLDHAQLAFFHKVVARIMILFQMLHVILSAHYWNSIHFPQFLRIPPQIFGWIAFTCLGLIGIQSIKLFRNWWFEVFLVQHRILSFIMLLFAYFHSKGNHAIIIVSVHALVLDRIIARVYVFLYKYRNPAKGMAEFRILDDSTFSMTLPTKEYDQRKWYHTIFPGLGCWRAGHHVYLTVSKISLFQQHPFTVANLGNRGKMYLLIKVKKGFTLKLFKKLQKLEEEAAETPAEESDAEEKDYVSLKATFHGPYGVPLQPLQQFDTSLFIGAGSGASFTFPVAIDLIETIVGITEANAGVSYFKPTNVKVVWIVPRKENTNWYLEALDTLSNYAYQYRDIVNITIDLYITRETDPNVDFSLTDSTGMDVISKDPLTDTEKTASSSQPLSTNKRTNSSDINTITKSETSTTSHTEFINFHYGRPDIEKYIEEQVAEVQYKSKYAYSSMAVVTCGPSQMTESVVYKCQRVRNRVGAPDLYVYDETF